MAALSLPTVTTGDGLTRYLAEIQKFPMLDADEEYMLAKRWKEHGDVAAAHRLVTSHLRLVAKIAMGYRGYGLPVGELISEGNIGMMQAVKKFEPDKGFRLATYAMWWIKASIQEYVLRSWSLVKIGTSAAQKRLFFNLRKIKNRIEAFEEGDLHPEHVSTIAKELDVTEEEVIDMNRRMSGGDQSLNLALHDDGEETFLDALADTRANQEVLLSEHQDYSDKHKALGRAMADLSPREQEILTARRLLEEPLTLEDLSKQYNISRERVRQIENKAFEKLQKTLLAYQQTPRPVEAGAR